MTGILSEEIRETSLAIPWLRIYLKMQGTKVRSLLGELGSLVARMPPRKLENKNFQLNKLHGKQRW